MWRLSAFFLTMTMVVFGWLVVELGLIGPTPLAAGGMPSAKPEASGVDSFYRSLSERMRSIETREAMLAQRERDITDKEGALRGQLERTEQALTDTKARLAELEAVSSVGVEAFRKIYESMEPREAARILNALEIKLAGRVLEGMRRDRAAEILGKMDTDKARVITERVVGRGDHEKRTLE